MSKTQKKLEITKGFDDEYYVPGAHITVDEAKALWKEYDGNDSKRVVYKVNHIWVRYGILPDDVTEEPGTHGWWVVDKSGRGVGKATQIELNWVK